MARYIDADELKKKINSRIGYFNTYYPNDSANISELQNCLEMVDDAPTEDIVPIVRGKWCRNDYSVYVCSNCGKISILKTPYCGYCIAKMEESEETQ